MQPDDKVTVTFQRAPAAALGATSSAFVFQFPATVVDWYDGDTCHVDRTAWPGIVIRGEGVRVQGMNAPELRAAGGRAATDYAKELCPEGTRITLVATKQDKYGRFLARLILPDGTDFAARMIAAGHAVSYLE